MNNDKLKVELSYKESKVMLTIFDTTGQIYRGSKKIVVIWIKKSDQNDPFSVFL